MTSEIIGIFGPNLSWIQSVLADRNQQVVLDGQISDGQTSAAVIFGGPQGTVLWPFLFMIYICYLPLKVSSSV